MKPVALVAACLALAACSQTPLPESRDGLPAVQMKNNTGDVAAPARKYLSIPARSFRAGPDSEWLEVEGAQCSVTSGLYRASYITPSRIILPDLGPDAEAMNVQCSYGNMRGTDVVQPDFSWPNEGDPSGFNKVIYGGGWWYGTEKSGPLNYGDIAVALK